MLIGGLQKFTALDYPDKIAATIFTVGCNFRCPFCHNGEIVEIGSENNFEIISEAEVLKFLKSRQGELDGVCITGGEPTLQKDLLEFIKKVRKMGFLVKVDTNGSNFEVVKNLVAENIVDYFAIDIKTTFQKYDLVSAPKDSAENTLRSVEFILKNSIPLELRTTMAPGVVALDDFDEIIRVLGEENDILSRLFRYSVQAFRPQKCLDDQFEKLVPYDDFILEEAANKIRKYCSRVDVVK